MIRHGSVHPPHLPGQERDPASAAERPGTATTDREALERFVMEEAPRALDALIRRYAGLVYGVARRRTGRHELAQEVAQNVFAALARKAAALSRASIPLAAWLHRAAVLESARAMRQEANRQRVMKEFATQAAVASVPESPALPEALLAELDEALDQLARSDRELIFARYFEDRAYRDIASATGRSEAALMQQHHRALEKLSRQFRRRGLAVSGAALAAGLSVPLTSAAPAGVVSTLGILGLGATPSLGLATSLHLALAMHTKTQIALAIAAACLLAGGASFFLGRTEGKTRAESRLAAARAADAEAAAAWQTGHTASHARKASAPSAPLPQDIQGKLAKAAADWRAASNDTDRVDALAVVDALGADEVPVALAFLEGIREENALYLALAERLLPLWAEHEPEAALAWLAEQLPRSRRQKPMERILGDWGGRDHEAALTWWKQVMDSLDFPIAENEFVKFDRHVIAGWAGKDPQALVSAMMSEKDETLRQHKDAMDGALTMAAANPESRERLIGALADLPNDAEKMTLYVKAMGPLMVVTDASTMREVALAFPLEKAENREDLLVMTAFTPLMFAGGVEEALGWLRQHMKDAAIRPAFERLLAGTVGELPKEAFHLEVGEFLPPDIIEKIRAAMNSNLPQ